MGRKDDERDGEIQNSHYFRLDSYSLSEIRLHGSKSSSIESQLVTAVLNGATWCTLKTLASSFTGKVVFHYSLP